MQLNRAYTHLGSCTAEVDDVRLQDAINMTAREMDEKASYPARAALP